MRWKGLRRRTIIQPHLLFLLKFPAQRWDERDWDTELIFSTKDFDFVPCSEMRWKGLRLIIPYIRYWMTRVAFPAQRWDERDWDFYSLFTTFSLFAFFSSLLRDEMKGIETGRRHSLMRFISWSSLLRDEMKGIETRTSTRSLQLHSTEFPAQRWDERDWDTDISFRLQFGDGMRSLLRDEMKGIETWVGAPIYFT